MSGKPEPDPRTLSRNWAELLSEIRVTQTGVQILTGFLLTVPFSGRFAGLTVFQQHAYLVVLGGAVLATGFILAPVAFHRMLFRHRRRQLLVDAADWCARAGLATLALTSSGALLLVFDVVAGPTTGWVSGAVALAFFATLWGATPRWLDRRDRRPRNPPPDQWESGGRAGHRADASAGHGADGDDRSAAPGE